MQTAPIMNLIGHLDALLNPAAFDDYGPNGLQVPGNDAIGTVVTGVSASVELFEQAAAHGADLVLVHHGLFWGETGPVDAQLKRRLKLLFEHDMALAAYHLPLDAHPELGNNALLARAMGATELEPFADHRGQPIGFLATLQTGLAGQFGRRQVNGHWRALLCCVQCREVCTAPSGRAQVKMPKRG